MYLLGLSHARTPGGSAQLTGQGGMAWIGRQFTLLGLLPRPESPEPTILEKGEHSRHTHLPLHSQWPHSMALWAPAASTTAALSLLLLLAVAIRAYSPISCEVQLPSAA